MVILLGSKNPNKRKSLEKALEKLQISDYEIISHNAQSEVSSKPIGYEIIRGADNRNQELKQYAKKQNINYDYLCSIEGGFSIDENGLPFIVTYCIVEDSNGKKSTGSSLGIRISKTMFEFIKNGGSLNKVIESIICDENNKQKQGITGYLSGNIYNREFVDCDAVVSAFIPFVFYKEREALDNQIMILTKNNELKHKK